MSATTGMDPYQALGNAVVLQAVKDYRDAVKKLSRGKKNTTAEQTKSRPNHALFVCYAPYEEPEIAIATRIPYGYSSDYAAQTTRDIIKYYYGLVEKDDLINGIADEPDSGISNEL